MCSKQQARSSAEYERFLLDYEGGIVFLGRLYIFLSEPYESIWWEMIKLFLEIFCENDRPKNEEDEIEFKKKYM